MKPAIVVKKLAKTYYEGTTPVHALKGANLAVHGGEVILLMGPSGSASIRELIPNSEVASRGTGPMKYRHRW